MMPSIVRWVMQNENRIFHNPRITTMPHLPGWSYLVDKYVLKKMSVPVDTTLCSLEIVRNDNKKICRQDRYTFPIHYHHDRWLLIFKTG